MDKYILNRKIRSQNEVISKRNDLKMTTESVA
ncbi:conserved hypothetical protein [Staphylococcus aureus A8819]|nr:hypothetical protein USA300HOU_2700 [Staphylococcus aureus subsp. aureus USA300_TCH1516]EFG39784.1 conserved hypothetical protein [Staphylococcus aureus A9754]EFG44337.1 conserved hypothetical protein [Staphylococcus aureus A8819]EFH36500.1 conserved hypothetical protein [Staphylococcus aureus A8796]EFT85519.1 hypothetical protein CGSSa03_11111 [Staphylococcus aureus subsp. aureus CGS03]EFU28232.1 hypothetical protein CGSSa01_15030 [Staphylococcus aureus subsp. aureus CGS01]